MLRLRLNERSSFSAALKASSQEHKAALRQRRSEMDRTWGDIDQGWKELQQAMNGIGITKPLDANQGMARLNAGGSLVTVHRSVLDGKEAALASGWTLGSLFEARWDKRLPVDSDGRYVIDESPIAVKHLIHALLTGSSTAGAGEPAADEKLYLRFVSRALSLMMPEPTDMIFTGERSNILGGADVRGTFEAALQGWFPGETLALTYRATRDGWTSTAFHAKCDDSQRTLTLYQVSSGRGVSIVGGFSSVSWAGASLICGGLSSTSWADPSSLASSPGAFIFVLNDGADGGGQRPFQPVKWGLKNDNDIKAVVRGSHYGPTFGDDLGVTFNGGPCTLHTHSSSYDIPVGSPILNLNGRTVSELEVFRVCPAAKVATPPKAAMTTLDESDASAVIPIQGGDDVRQFGALIAGSLMEERMALRDAEIELRRARAKVAAAGHALEAVYGPDIAAGKEDPVIELSVRGTRMTTLRSTLQVCPDSALATRFDQDKWPAHEKDLDELGRRVIDCSPSVFSKVLDVLRMRKRTAWNGGQIRSTVHVAVKAEDREEFEEFVNMQFPGCESFVMDYAYFLEEPQPAV